MSGFPGLQYFSFQGPDVRPFPNSPFNVLNYGADNSGATDTITQLQAAANACAQAGGGILYFPFGTYLISTTLLLGDNTLMTGDGPDQSILVANNSFLGAVAADNSTNGSSCLVANTQLATASLVPVQQNITVSNLGFNGNGQLVPRFLKNPGGCIFFRMVYNVTVTNCSLINCAASGIVVTGTDDHTLWPNVPNIAFDVNNNHINMLYNPNGPPPLNGGKGLSGFPIVCRGASIGIIYDNTIGDLFDSLGIHTNDGIDVPGCSDALIYGNYISNCGDGIGCDSCNNITIVGNTINKSGGYGISSFSSGGPDDDPIGCNNMTIVGNNITNHGQNAGNNPGKTGIRFSTPGSKFPSATEAANATISGNLIQFDANAGGPFGIHVEGNYASVTGNTIDLGLAQKSPGLGLTGIEIDCAGGGGNYCTLSGNTIWDGFANANGIVFSIGNGNQVTGATITGNNVDPTTITTPIVPHAASGAENANIINSLIKGNTFNKLFGTLTLGSIGASPATVTNLFAYDAMVVLNTGNTTTVSQLAVDGDNLNVTMAQNTSFMFYLSAGSSFTVTYSGTNIGYKAHAL